MCVVQGRSGLAGSQTGRSFPKRSFARPSWMDEETVDSADMSESLFFSKVSNHYPAVSALAVKCLFVPTFFGILFFMLRHTSATRSKTFPCILRYICSPVFFTSLHHVSQQGQFPFLISFGCFFSHL